MFGTTKLPLMWNCGAICNNSHLSSSNIDTSQMTNLSNSYVDKVHRSVNTQSGTVDDNNSLLMGVFVTVAGTKPDIRSTFSVYNYKQLVIVDSN